MPRMVQTSAAQSVVAVDDTVPAADGVAASNISITLYNTEVGAEPVPIVGAPASSIVVTSTGTNNTIAQPSGVTDANGTITGASIKSTTAESKTLTVTVAGVELTNKPVVVFGGSAPDPTPGDPFFEDDFALGVKNNANGFTWSSTGSRVTVQLAPDASGDYALRFRYGPDAIGADSSAEQRFALGRQLSELWLDYYLWIPANFALRNDAPFNNKFLSLWPLNYSTTGDTFMVTEFERNGTDTSYARILGYGDLFYADGTLSRGGDAVQNSNFINAAKAGAWTRIQVHYKMASGAGQTDGVYEGWVNGSLQWRSRTDWVFWSTGGNNYIANGFFMGWANSGYTDTTDFYIRGGTNGPKFYDTDPEWGLT